MLLYLRLLLYLLAASFVVVIALAAVVLTVVAVLDAVFELTVVGLLANFVVAEVKASFASDNSSAFAGAATKKLKIKKTLITNEVARARLLEIFIRTPSRIDRF